MSLVMTAAPAVEPVTLAETKAHLRVDGTAEDAYLTSLIVTSRLQIEAALGLALITQSWRWSIDDWPDNGVIELPMRPVQTIDEIEITHLGGAPSTLSPSYYRLDGQAAPALLALTTVVPPHSDAPISGIAIEFTAGFGAAAASVPQPIRHALLLLVAHWYECREPHEDDKSPVGIPAAVSSLLMPYRVVRL